MIIAHDLYVNIHAGLKRMKIDISKIIRDNELTQLKAIRFAWNELVKKADYWLKRIDNEVGGVQEKRKLKNQIKNRLLSECSNLIRDLKFIKFEGQETILKKVDFREELKDRFLYIKQTY